MIEQVLHKINKEITKLIYEEDLNDKPDEKEILDVLQYHIFLALPYILSNTSQKFLLWFCTIV